jgi:hypothetical protein
LEFLPQFDVKDRMRAKALEVIEYDNEIVVRPKVDELRA